MSPRRPSWSASNLVTAGGWLLVAVVAFFAIASERELLIAGVVACVIALGLWETWWSRRRRRQF
jgi:membrane protein DedA with SNARE-associated domain